MFSNMFLEIFSTQKINCFDKNYKKFQMELSWYKNMQKFYIDTYFIPTNNISFIGL